MKISMLEFSGYYRSLLKAFLFGVVVLLLSSSAYSDIGDSKQQLILKYGSRYIEESLYLDEGGSAKELYGSLLVFEGKPIIISCKLIEGYCECISYSSETPLSQKYITDILSRYASTNDWKAVESDLEDFSLDKFKNRSIGANVKNKKDVAVFSNLYIKAILKANMRIKMRGTK